MPRGVYRRTPEGRKHLSEALKGRKLSEQHRKHMSEGMKGSPNTGRFSKGQIPWNKGTAKPKIPKVIDREAWNHSISIAMSKVKKTPEWRRNLSLALMGRKHSPERVRAIVDGVVRQRKQPRGITRLETRFLEILKAMYGQYVPYKYTGNRRFFIRTLVKLRVPDFVYESERKIIEIYSRYWHAGEDPKDRIEEYAAVGWKCMVVWEDELDGTCIDRVQEFTFPAEYWCEYWDTMRVSV